MNSPDDHGGTGRRGPLLAFLRLFVDRARADEVLDDLREGARSIQDARGPLAGRRWLLGQLIAFGMRGSWERLRDAAGALSQAATPAALGSDLRFGLRSLRRNPTVSVVAVLTLGIGIGGSTAVLTVVDAALLEPLPYEQPEELVALELSYRGDSWWSAATAEAIAFRDARSLSGIGWAQRGTATLSDGDEPVHLRTVRASADLLDVLGVSPLLGRELAPGEDLEGAAPVVLLTHAFWETRFTGDPAIVGSTLSLDDQPHTVVGVLPPGSPLGFVGEHQVVVPRTLPANAATDRGRVLTAVARLSSGSSPEAASVDLTDVLQRTGDGSMVDGWTVRAVPLRDELVADVELALWILLGAIAAVLAVACLNVSNVLLARGVARSGEIGLRTALGAGRARIFTQLLIEALVLSAAGGLLGVLLAGWALSEIVASAATALPLGVAPALDARLVGFAVAVSALAGVGFGTLPAFRARGTGGVGRNSRGGSASPGEGRLGRVLVSLELAMVVVLLAAATVMGLSYRALQEVDPGFDPAPLAALQVAVLPARYPTVDDQVRLGERLAGALATVPGVAAVGSVSNLPFEGDGWTAFHVVEDGTPVLPGEEPTGGFEVASPDYFDALGLPLLEGRTFTSSEAAEGRNVVVVNRRAAEMYWPGRSPIGQRVRYGPAGSALWADVVGVVGSARYQLGQPERPRFYLPERRVFGPQPTRTFVVRTATEDPRDVFAGIREAVLAEAPGLPIASLRPMTQVAGGSLAGARLQAALLAAFGLTGLLLGAVGVYGVVSHSVSRRTREMGVRLALGAHRSGLLGHVVQGAMRPAILGSLLGLGAAAALGRLLEARVYGVSAADPVVLVSIAAILLTVAGVASLLPALRAARLDPARILREE